LIYLHFFKYIQIVSSIFTPWHGFFRLLDVSVRTRVATFSRLKSGSWRAQLRRKGKYVNETFVRRKDAEEWALDIERRIDRQERALEGAGPVTVGID
jgi:hypothetical protein